MKAALLERGYKGVAGFDPHQVPVHAGLAERQLHELRIGRVILEVEEPNFCLHCCYPLILILDIFGDDVKVMYDI